MNCAYDINIMRQCWDVHVAAQWNPKTLEQLRRKSEVLKMHYQRTFLVKSEVLKMPPLNMGAGTGSDTMVSPPRSDATGGSTK
mmetsp:Transcript_33012/g.83294  ORF Transcript_33012/g.83294 Transcript_33012/m.83294 type:complete len:83 (+) Transcript_33012:203-451(+)